MKKRFLAALLSLCMTLTLLPTTAFAAVSDSLGNTPEENQAILEQVSALTGDSSDQVLSMLNALGLLDEDGNFKVDQTITLDGQVLTLAAVMELLENPTTDLTRIADVDGTPVALGDLKTMIQIEQELQRIKDTYFSGREFTGEALENLNSLMEQLELQGISLQYSASATAPVGVETVDMSGMMSQTLGDLANNSWSSGTFTVYGGKPVGFSYRIQKGQLSEYITGVEVSIGETSKVVEQSDGSYKLTYEVDGYSLGGQEITVKVTTKGSTQAWHDNSYSYGDLLGMIEFYDAENLVFYDGAAYADHCQLKLKKTVGVPTIQTSMTAPSYVEELKNTTVLYDDLFIPLLAESYTGGSADNSDFIALSNTIGILEGARNSVSSSNSTKSYQPYQIDASIEFSWSGDIVAYNGSAPYGNYISANPIPYAPFCLTEYKLDGTALTLTTDGKKTENCTINNGSMVSISLQSTTQNRENHQYYLPFELYLKNVNRDTPNSTTTATTSNVTATLLDTDTPTIQSVTAPVGTYASGQHVPITVTFNEFVDLRNATVTINGKVYSAAELSMNNYGVTAMLWYPVQDADDTTVTVNGMTGVEDVFGHTLDTSLYPSNSITDVDLKSVLMRNAPTALTADYADGKASFTMNANMEQVYKTVYSNYHTPAGTDPKEAPFRLELRYDSAIEPIHLQVYLDTEKEAFTISDYAIAPSALDRTYTVTLQANEGTKADPDWVNVLPLTRQFTVAKKVSASTVKVVPEENDADYTISLGKTTRPTLKAEVLGAGGETASYTTGKWSSSDTLIATINEDTGVVATTGTKVGAVTFTFTADNGTEDTADDVTGKSEPYTVTAGDSLALVIPGGASIVTRVNQPATVLWSSNATLMAPNKEFNYRIDLYEGNYANEAALSGRKPVATYTVGKDKNSVRIEENVLSKLSNGNTPAYTVLVSMPHPNAGGEDVRLSALAWIIVQAPPATAKLTPPQSIYLKDTDGAVNIDWSVENTTDGAHLQPTLTITRVTEDNTTKVVDSERLSGTSGSVSLSLQSVKAGNLKDTYQVVLSVENPGEESPSTDSFPLYVYDADALKVQNDKGETISKLTMDNTSKVSGSLPTVTAEIMQLRQELGLIEYIGINYDEYGWNSFKDGIRWLSSNNNAISVNYKQGGLYEDIRNFSFDSYLPETKMALSGLANGTATVTATHAATGMNAAVQVTAKTLQNKFYLFQLTPAAETTLQYTDGKGVPKTVTTNSEGVLALYEPNGIASEVSLRSGSGADIYLGTIYKENLRSGERDATKLQLYPLNTFSLRRVARASVTLITPGGDPLANKTVTVRGGVYKNGGYCETALLGSRAGALVSGITGDTYTTDAAGNITVYLDSTQFWSAEKGESNTTALSAMDQLEYILEISAIDGDKYYPLLLTVNGKLGVDDVMRTAEGVVSLERVPAGEENKPFIVAQSVDYGLANGQKVDVRSSTGKIGPNSSFKTARLHTTMFLWGEKIANARNYSLKLADEYGVIPAAQSSSTKQYPFSSIPVAENDLTLTETTMTTSGWIADGKDVGIKTQLRLNGSLLQEKIMPFRVVDLTRVPKVTEDDRVTGILATMGSSSGVNQVDFGGVGDSNILKVLTGRLDDLSGPVDTSVFKMIITPSEDPSVFRAMIWAGYNTLEMEDMDYSEDGVALGANVLTQNLEVGVPGTGDLSQMAQGTYDPKGDYKTNSIADNVTSTDLNLQLEGFYEAEIRYNTEKKEWEVFTVGGGFTTGVGVGFSFSVNAMAGPVPLTATFELGGAIQLDFRTAVRYGRQGEGTELAWSDPTATAVGGDGKAIVFWRNVYTPDPGTQGSNNLLNFTTRDCIMYSCYDSTNGTWSKAKMLYNGATGSVKALQAAMLPDGTAMAVYSLDRSGTGDTSAYEIAYCTVAADGTPGTAMLATCDSNLDENPQVVAANFGSGDDRFVIGWHSVRDGSSDIQLLAVDGSGTMSNSFPGSLSTLTSSGNAVVGGDFHFASLSGDHRSRNDLTIIWNETVNNANGAVDHGILKAAKLRYATNTYTLSAPLELAELPDRTLADHFDAYVSGTNQVQAAIQATRYDDENPQVIGGVTVPGEETILYTATSDFVTDAVAVEQIGVDYATLALNSLTPIHFTIRNTGLNDVTNLTVSLGSGETATLTEKLLPNESTTLTVWHHVKDRVTDPGYTITAAGGIHENGTVYLDYPDIGISQMEVIAESAGKRTVRMTLYNSAAATLAGGKSREVKLAFYADDLHTEPAEVACTTNGVSVNGNEITISEDSALARIDQGTFTLDLTYDLGEYMTFIGKTEIPNVGTYLYAEAWAEGKVGGTGSNQRLPEYNGSDSEASVHMTGALARTGEQLTMDVTQGNDGNGHSTAAITLRNNCLQSQTGAELVATLLDAAGTVLETKKTSIGGAISGETFQTETVTFSRLGTRVVVRAAVPGKDLLTFEGLAVGLGDFTANGTNYTYTLQNDSGATSTLVTAVSGNGEPVSINGQALSTGGSATVAIPNSGTTDIVVRIGAKTYTLTILRNSGTGGNEGNSGTGGNEGGSGSGGGSGYSYYTIKATAGAGGSISPSGNVSVREGRDQTFTITPDKGYAVANVKIDGKSIGAAKSYTFENVSRTHTIEVIFMKANGNPQTGVFVDVATGSYYEDAVDCAVLFSLQETN